MGYGEKSDISTIKSLKEREKDSDGHKIWSDTGQYLP